MPLAYRRLGRPLALALTPPWRVGLHDLHLADLVDHRIGEHRHRDHELMLIRRGTWAGSVDGRAITVPAPALLHLQPGQRHRDDCGSRVVFAGLHLDLLPGPEAGMSARVLAPTASPVQPLDATLLRELEALVAAMEAVVADPGLTGGPALDALAAAFLWRCLGRRDPADLIADLHGYRDGSDFALRLEDVFHQRERTSAGLRDLAAAMGMSPRTLSDRCRRVCGDSPTRLFQRHRLAAARDGIKSSAMSVAEAARHFGFASAAHFSTAFKRHFGFPPRAAR